MMVERTYKDLEAVNAGIPRIDIKGKQYATVDGRIVAFRKLYPSGFIKTQLLRLDEDVKTGICVFKAVVGFGDTVLGEGTAYEKADGSYINKTSYIENCETSAIGRALGMAGFGVDGSIASAEEVANAIKNQGGAQILPDPDGILVCNQCGTPIDEKVHDYSARRFGRPLCRKCQGTQK